MSRLTFHLIPHTHWDREWCLPRAAYQTRLIPVLDAVLEQLEADADARFLLDGQTILLEDYLAIRPEQESRLAQQVARGALEIGPWYVLSDLLLPSAASLRRNLAEGARDCERFGRRLDVLYSPDAFGHPAELPRLAAEFGLRRAVIRRGIGRPDGRDRDCYRWESPDGASLLVHHLPAGGYDVAIDLAKPGDDLPGRWQLLRRELVGRAGTDQIAVFLGADHHAMVPRVTALRDRLQALEPGHTVRVSGLTEFFAAVERSRPVLPVLAGELRRGDGHAWVLQDVHGTRSRLKRRHGSAELMLSRLVEPLAAERNPDLLRSAWRILLACQFHDTLAGTTCDAAQEEQALRLASVETVSEELTRSAFSALAPGTAPGRLLLWNPATRERSGIVTAELTFFRRDVLVGQRTGRQPRTGPGYRPFALEAAGGERIPVQLLAKRRDQERIDSPSAYPDQDRVDRVWVAFQAPAVPARGAQLLRARPARLTPPAGNLRVSGSLLRNRRIAVRVSPLGALSLTDLEHDQRYEHLATLVDQPDRGDTYTFSRGSGAGRAGGTPLGQQALATGPLVAAIATHWTLPGAAGGVSVARQVVIVTEDSPVLRIRLELDNRGEWHRLRARFPVGVTGDALAGTALGAISRPPGTASAVRHQLEQEAPTAPAHRYLAVARGKRGLALFAPAAFEYEWSGGQLQLTLLRAVGELSRDDLAERPGHAAWPMATPLAQEPGRHRLDLALSPVTEDAAHPDLLEHAWEDVMLPVQSRWFRA